MASGKFIIKIDSSKVDSTLTDFPVMIYLSGASGTGSFDATKIFDDLGSNSKKIKVKNSSGTELYCEIEMWDDTAEKAVLHVKVDSVSSSADTELTLEWDSTWSDNDTYIGDTGDTAAENVWDSNFVAVYHMNQDPSGGAGAILDSTSNRNNSTSSGSMTSGDLVDADYGKAIDFDGSNDYLTSVNNIGISGSQNRTIEVGINTSRTIFQRIVGWGPHTTGNEFSFVANTNATDDYRIAVTGGNKIWHDTIIDSNWHILAATLDGNSTSDLTGYIDGGTASVLSTSALTVNTTDTPLGVSKSYAVPGVDCFLGKIKFVRVSNVARSSAWIKATNASLTDDLLSFSISIGLPALSFGIGIEVGTIIGDSFLSLPAFDVGLSIPATPVSHSVPTASMEFCVSVDIGDIFLTRYITLTPFNLGLISSFGNINQSVVLPSAEIGIEIDTTVLQSIPFQPFSLDLAIELGEASSFETGSAIIRYFCILTGAADGTTDLTLPMLSFQARRRSGDPTYLRVVVPTVDYADEIAVRPNGTLKIQQAYEQNGVIKQIETIMETDLEDVSPDEGGTNQSTTLVGYSASSYEAKAVTLTGVTYRSTRGGKYRYRLARPHIFLNPGDTVIISNDGVVFEIDTMSYFINPTTSTIELEST